MEKLFEKIARLSLAIKLILLIATPALILIVFYFGIYQGASDKGAIEREEANLRRAQRKVAQAKREKAQEKRECEQLKKKLTKTKRKIKRFQGMLPDDPQISLLIKEIKSKLSGLMMVEYTRQPEVPKKIHAVIPLDLKVRGSFHELLRFLHELSIMPRIVNVQNIGMTDAKLVEGKVRLQVSFRISTFRYLRRKAKTKKGRKKS
jgi:type IV pilus assembly protein PilO